VAEHREAEMSLDTETPQDHTNDALFCQWQDKVKDANISGQTLLATDYLNHFNEIVMLIDMVPDMPELLDECKEWAPKSYQDHFRDSTFSDRDLAIEAYDHVPQEFRTPFEDTIEQMNHLVEQCLHRLDEALELNDPELVKIRAHASSRGLQRLMDVANAIIHGSSRAMDQGEIDQIIGF
jgi:division protein CdvB (Snf7/Vps24/ESCRT-III family)